MQSQNNFMATNGMDKSRESQVHQQDLKDNISVNILEKNVKKSSENNLLDNYNPERGNSSLNGKLSSSNIEL